MLIHLDSPMEATELLRQKDARIAALEAAVALLEEQLSWLKKLIFGPKSERIVADLPGQTVLDFGPMPAATPPKEETEEITYQRRKASRNRGADTLSFPEDLPVKRIELDVPPEEKVCPETGKPLVCIGYDIRRKLARKAEQFYIIEYVRPKYASKANPDLGIKTASLPETIIERCPADESLLAFILTAKFADHLPLYRLVEMLGRSEVHISRQTLSKWVVTLGMALSPLYEAMKARILESGVLFVDASPVRVQDQGLKRCRQAYMWVYVGAAAGTRPTGFSSSAWIAVIVTPRRF